MTFAIRSASFNEKQCIFNLFQPYLNELSLFPDEEIDYKDKEGIYHYTYLDAYWQENERYPYLLFYNSEIAGFALVRHDGEHWQMAEFYVMTAFRRRGLALACAVDIFRSHPGDWKIGFHKRNQPSRELWQKLAERFSKGNILAGEWSASHDYIQFSV